MACITLFIIIISFLQRTEGAPNHTELLSPAPPRSPSAFHLSFSTPDTEVGGDGVSGVRYPPTIATAPTCAVYLEKNNIISSFPFVLGFSFPELAKCDCLAVVQLQQGTSFYC